jgi:hypothetical protein
MKKLPTRIFECCRLSLHRLSRNLTLVVGSVSADTTFLPIARLPRAPPAIKALLPINSLLERYSIMIFPFFIMLLS